MTHKQQRLLRLAVPYIQGITFEFEQKDFSLCFKFHFKLLFPKSSEKPPSHLFMKVPRQPLTSFFAYLRLSLYTESSVLTSFICLL